MRKYVLFGAGQYGKSCLEFLGAGKVKYFVDNDPHKQGTYIENIRVLSCEEMVKEIAVTCSYDCQCRLCLACHCCDKQSLRWCRKTVPVSTGIRQPAPTLFYLDSHWKRRIPCICNQSRSADERIPSHHFCDNRKNR